MRTKDGWLTMLPYSGENWCAFFEAVGHPECIEEFSVRDPVLRASNIDKIYDRMSEIALSRTTAEWEELLLRHRRPARRIRQADRGRRAAASESGRHVRGPRPSDRGADPPGPAVGPVLGEPASIRRMAPRLGEHTREVLRETGYSDAEIASLVESKAVGVLS